MKSLLRRLAIWLLTLGVLAVPLAASSLLYASLAADMLEAFTSRWALPLAGVWLLGLLLILPVSLAWRLSKSAWMASFPRAALIATCLLLWQCIGIALFPALARDPRRLLMARGPWLPERVAGPHAFVTRAVGWLFWRPQEVVTVYLDKTGKPAIPHSYGAASSGFSEGLAKVVLYGKCGYMNPKGELVLPASYTQAYPFGEGLAFVQETPGGKFSVIDGNGATVLPPLYREGSLFVQGFAYVETEEERGYIDKAGKFVIHLDKSAGSFSEGLLAVRDLDGGIRYVDGTEHTVIHLKNASQGGPFKNSKAAVLDRESNLWGFIDRQGEWVMRPGFANAESFSEGLAAVQPKAGGPWGFINREGSMAIAPTLVDKPGNFQDGRSRIQVGGLYGFIDTNGQPVVRPRLTRAGDFKEGLAQAFQGDYYGFIDKQGKWAIPPCIPGKAYLNRPGLRADTLTTTMSVDATISEGVVAAPVVLVR